MLLSPTAITHLDHRAYYLRGAPVSKSVLAASADGYVSTISRDFTVRANRIAEGIQAISPHPSHPQIAWVDGKSGKLIVQDATGKRIADIPPPRTDRSASPFTAIGFEDCLFADSGDRLWLVAHLSDEQVEVSLVDVRTWSLISKSVVADPFGEGSCSFQITNSPGRISLWIAAGQNGQTVYWLNAQKDGFTLDQELDLTNTTPPTFSADGSRFLITVECMELCQYEFSTGRKLGPSIKSDIESDPFAESLCYLDNCRAIAATNDGRVFLIDTTRMEVVEEVIVEGHEPRPAYEYYPGLGNERGLVTDIAWFTRIGNAVAFVCRRDGGVGLQGWKDSLLWYEVV